MSVERAATGDHLATLPGKFGPRTMFHKAGLVDLQMLFVVSTKQYLKQQNRH